MSNISVIKTTNFNSSFEPSVGFYEKATEILFSRLSDFEYGTEPKDCKDKDFINDETFNFFLGFIYFCDAKSANDDDILASYFVLLSISNLLQSSKSVLK